MSFKKFSTTHNTPAKANPAGVAANGKTPSPVERPSAAAGKAPPGAKPAGKP